ncbi:hypothetical protein WA026_019432 [Henosepilachna vigintioctopunctata]|uniref:Ankyrin repeat protein n=1 Tax=Henosepilachna vigintioctopunctata TaxID=420089 RepID=A0AAW1U1Z6_9CUCU
MRRCRSSVNTINVNGDTPPHIACSIANYWCIETGADPNIPNENGNSPLHTSALQIETNKTQIFARILVEYEVNVDPQNNNKETPLHIAVYEGKEYLVEVLLESGASINIPDLSERTAMDKALLVNLEQLEEVCENERFSKFKKSCEDEIQKLKATLVGDSAITFYDIFLSSTPLVARYLFNTSILASLSEFNIGQSISGSILMKKLEIASSIIMESR